MTVLCTHMYKYKNKNIVGQRANTQCQNIVNRLNTVQVKVNASVMKYNMAHMALGKLGNYGVGCVEW